MREEKLQSFADHVEAKVGLKKQDRLCANNNVIG
jgi:hypothetical protein